MALDALPRTVRGQRELAGQAAPLGINVTKAAPARRVRRKKKEISSITLSYYKNKEQCKVLDAKPEDIRGWDQEVREAALFEPGPWHVAAGRGRGRRRRPRAGSRRASRRPCASSHR